MEWRLFFIIPWWARPVCSWNLSDSTLTSWGRRPDHSEATAWKNDKKNNKDTSFMLRGWPVLAIFAVYIWHTRPASGTRHFWGGPRQAMEPGAKSLPYTVWTVFGSDPNYKKKTLLLFTTCTRFHYIRSVYTGYQGNVVFTWKCAAVW